jgi:hypothetical protein
MLAGLYETGPCACWQGREERRLPQKGIGAHHVLASAWGKEARGRLHDDRHIKAGNVVTVWEPSSTSKEVMMTRNVIIGIVVIVVLVAGYFLWKGNDTGQQSLPTSTTEKK